MLNMMADRDGLNQAGEKVLVAGDTVEYCAHVVGGMVQVKLADGRIEIVHPCCFPQLR